MFDERLCRFLRFLNLLNRNFGVIAIKYNKETKTLHQDPNLRFCVARNHHSFAFWHTCAFAIIIKYHFLKDVDRFNVTLAYELFGIIVLILYTALWCFVQDICIMANGFSQFIKYIQSKEAIFTKIIFDTGLLIFLFPWV